ncbi:hypothetical protein QFZ53_001700 [Microbacterium natoriense]|uniref:Uncharacterized protein n=1 Tax=Microbacterium natoriense TaxID=284570 RepID=A0AAW8EXV9_9MICO|nr:hypothetical protein [Microbacterium natoriense]MDQ0647504.1 hypothetical protein [Microbacterium natoriense]
MFENEVSNSGGADDGLINPAGFIVRAGDLDTSTITAAASGVAGIGTGVVGAVDSVSTAWTTVKAPGVFETPDAGAVYTLMDPAVAGAADMNGVTSRISSALETYAAELEAIKPDLEDIEQDAWDFRSEALAGYEVTNIEARGWLGSFTTGIDGNPVMMDDSYETTTISWREHDPAVAKNEKLVHRFEAILARVSTAATTCANAIQAELQLVCAAPFDAITAEALANSPEFSTWGAAVSEQRNVTESIGFGLANFGKGIWTGGELITGYDAQTGVRSWDTFWKTVGGLGDFVGSTLAVTNVPFMIAGIASMGTNSPFRDFFTDRINTVASSWGSIVGWDQQAHLAGENGWHKWEEDGIAAATESVANVGTFFIPVANIGKVVVVGTKVGSFVVRGVAGVAEFVIPAGSHLVTGVVKVVELTSTGVKTGFRGLIDAIRDTHINVTVKPTTVPGTLNTTLDITHLDTPVKPGTAVSDALGLETVRPEPLTGGDGSGTTSHEVKPPRVINGSDPVSVPETVGPSHAPESYTSEQRAEAWENAWRNEDGVRVDPRTGAPLVEFNRAGGAGWEMRWVPEWNEWVAFNKGDGWGTTPRPIPPEFDVDLTRASQYASNDVHYPGEYPPHTPDATYTKGSDESGWAPVNRGDDKPWMHAQEQISGILRDDNGHLLEWHQVDPDTSRIVEFDGHTWRGGPPPVEVFLEVKDGYSILHWAPESLRALSQAESIVDQIGRQLDSLPNGAILEWHVTDPWGAAAIRRILLENQIVDVEVVYTPRIG